MANSECQNLTTQRKGSLGQDCFNLVVNKYCYEIKKIQLCGTANNGLI